MPRDAKGYTIKDTWDVLGMRATRSDDTVLDGAFVPDKYIARVVPAGAAGADMFVLGFFTWALVGFANVYYGLALRVREVIVEQLKTKTSIALTRPMTYHPEIQHGIAEITMDLEAMGPHVEAIASDWTEGRVGPDWFLRLVAMKHHKVVEAAFRIADSALDLSGGFGMFKKSELERLFRDARAGQVPSGQPAAHARDRRQDLARHQPRRAATLGLEKRSGKVEKLKSGKVRWKCVSLEVCRVRGRRDRPDRGAAPRASPRPGRHRVHRRAGHRRHRRRADRTGDHRHHQRQDHRNRAVGERHATGRRHDCECRG